jgi:hypothetical protein
MDSHSFDAVYKEYFPKFLASANVLPIHQVERGVSSALALCGAVAFSFLISNISNLVSKGNSVEVRYILSLSLSLSLYIYI